MLLVKTTVKAGNIMSGAIAILRVDAKMGGQGEQGRLGGQGGEKILRLNATRYQHI